MNKDYRRTTYDGNTPDFLSKKKQLKQHIQENQPNVTDMHRLLCNNDNVYKTKFMQAYDNRCAYCGVSLTIIEKSQFEIDHFIPKVASQFSSKVAAGYMENLVLSCSSCNRYKSNYVVPNNYLNRLHPDNIDITKTFYRDSDFYIKIHPSQANDSNIRNFYSKLQFGKEVHRLDYLLMNLIGLQDTCRHHKNESLTCALAYAICLLQRKRNLGIQK